MPVLGQGGTLFLKRELPEAIVLPQTAINSLYDSLFVGSQTFWSGDQVRLTCASGLPIDFNSDGYADCPDGHAIYAESVYPLAPNRQHVSSDQDSWYSQVNSDGFYATVSDVGFVQAASFFIYRDQLDRVSFYSNQADAVNGEGASRVQLFKVACGPIVLSPSGTDDYESAILECSGDLGDYQYSDIQDEVTLSSICSYAPDYLEPVAGTLEYDNADAFPRSSVDGSPWIFQAFLQGWTLNLTSQEQDITSVGEKFGDAIKTLVTGGGSADFIVDRQFADGEQDTSALLQLLLLIEKGCKATARFNLIGGQKEGDGDSTLVDRLYYETSLLINRSAINTRVDQVIVGSIDFVTTGQISLKMGRS